MRQDDELWSLLHGGRLTTARLKDALGLFDATAGPLAAYHHLCGDIYDVVDEAVPEAVAIAHNERLRLQQRPAVASGGRSDGSGSGATGVQDFAAWSAPPGADESQAHARSSRQVAALGPSSLRMAWGSVQEASAVFCLSHVFPASQLLEVGLFEVPSSLSVAAAWGLDGSDLPPMGASPDALIQHTVCLTPADVQRLRKLLLQRKTLGPCSGLFDAAASQGGGGVQEDEAADLALLLRELLEMVQAQSAQVQPPRASTAVAAGAPVADRTASSSFTLSATGTAGDAPQSSSSSPAGPPHSPPPPPPLSGSSSSLRTMPSNAAGPRRSNPATAASAREFSAQAVAAPFSPPAPRSVRMRSTSPPLPAEPLTRPNAFTGRAAAPVGTGDSASSQTSLRGSDVPAAAAAEGPGSLQHSALEALRQLRNQLLAAPQAEPAAEGSTSSAEGGSAGSLHVTLTEVVEVKNHCPFRLKCVGRGCRGTRRRVCMWRDSLGSTLCCRL